MIIHEFVKSVIRIHNGSSTSKKPDIVAFFSVLWFLFPHLNRWSGNRKAVVGIVLLTVIIKRINKSSYANTQCIKAN